ncbi:Uridine diphosphate glucose pyrophosphatase NUDT14-like [Homarus americanus]|uniref:Uridine diphosphate glucose pyrophosphatase NUDT14-like n=1 Tax=Homarus americanus TaxID=6706 RepID=A0A8J5MY67_HOMAM|nr:Uridine diphosphate glucose pyrophosphatase NUDT14-like [Homarus americanus]
MEGVAVQIKQEINEEEIKPPLKKKYNRPPTSRIVHDAIINVGSKEKGASVQKIKKYIFSTYRLDDRKTEILINNYIKKAVRSGKLIRCSAVYYNGIPPEDRVDVTIDTTKYPGIRGLTLELCAGIVDKRKDLVEIAKEETMFYVEVTDSMKVSDGGGVAEEGEMIEVVELSMAELQVFIKQSEVNCPGGLLFGLMWFLQHKAPKD